MKRRDFLNISAKMAATPLLLNTLPINAISPFGFLNPVDCDEQNDRVLIIVQLNGGNDGLNTVITTGAGQEKYETERPNLAITENLRSLSGQDFTHLHPSMGGLQALYDNGKVNIIQGTGYANNIRSHFESTDIMFTAGDMTPNLQNLEEGWMGKYLEYTYGVHMANPYTSNDIFPYGLQFGNRKPALGFRTASQHIKSVSVAGDDPGNTFKLITAATGGYGDFNFDPTTDYGKKLQHIINISSGTSLYAQRLKEAFGLGANSGVVYPQSYLAGQLKSVAKLISGGCKTKIYLVDILEFDTHANQLGKHASLLADLSQSIKAFMDDLALLNLDHRVAIATFSEFGRKLIENGSLGTDHGTISPMFVVGANLTGGLYGGSPNLEVLDDGAPTGLYYDYRHVFARLLKQWLGASHDALVAAGLAPWVQNTGNDPGFPNNGPLDLISQNKLAPTDCPVCPIGAADASCYENEINIVVNPDNLTDEGAVVSNITACDTVALSNGFWAKKGAAVTIKPMDCTPAGAKEMLGPIVDKSKSANSGFEDPVNDFFTNKQLKGNLDGIEAFPNPFDHRVTVSFLPQKGEKDVVVRLLDNWGKVVQTSVIYSYYKEGYYSVVLSGAGLTSGVYYAVFRSEKRRETIKLIKG